MTTNFKDELEKIEKFKKYNIKLDFQNQLNDVSLSNTHSFNKFFTISSSNNKEKTSGLKIDNLFRQQVVYFFN